MSIINLTPHNVCVFLPDGRKWGFPASGDVARLATIELGSTLIEGVPVERVEFHHLLKPPPRLADTWYIVSLPTALAQPRGDFLVPYMEVRNDAGQIIGCRMLARPV